MQHTLRISVSRKPQTGGVVAIRNISVRERILRFLLGEKHKLTILVPGDTVSDIEINQIKNGGNEENGGNERDEPRDRGAAHGGESADQCGGQPGADVQRAEGD